MENKMALSCKEIAERLKGLREMMEISPEEMAKVTNMTVDQYLAYEAGDKDFSVTMLYNCANRFGVDVTELMTGQAPKLSSYSLVRAGEGEKVERRHNFTYEHLAINFKDRTADPFLVHAPYIKGSEEQPISLSVHKGQEMDYILSGELTCSIDGHIVVVHEGDTLYYDSGKPHGMIATGGKACDFIAIVLKEDK